jgi:hypothetical protein
MYPVAQVMNPSLQRFVGASQALPAAQASQAPERQTMLVPHPVPSVTRSPVSVQAPPAPEVQDRAPTWHGFAGWHWTEQAPQSPPVQGTHAPAEQLMPASQA